MSAQDGTRPMGVGSRTGRGLGRCGRRAGAATAVADPYRDCGLGWGYWPRADGRRRRSGGRGRGRGQGSARVSRTAEDSADPTATARQRKNFLRRRLQALTEERNRVKVLLLAEYSPSHDPDEE
jgi:hypothetical protein